MGQKKNSHAPEEAHINLTPMIDVTFQLIIFFMLVSQLTSMTMLNVTLPIAPHAEELGTKKPKQERVVINITGDRKISFGQGDDIQGEGDEMLKNLVNRLLQEAEARPKLYSTSEEAGGQRISELEVFIRCDRSIESQLFLYVLHACNEAKIYKVDIGTKLAYRKS